MDEETTIWKIFMPTKSNNLQLEDANNNSGENNQNGQKIENV